MSNPNIERNKEIVKLVKRGYSFGKIAEVFKIRKQTAHEIYHRDKTKFVRSYQQKQS